MPELPEVETVVRDLRPWIVGQRIRAVQVGPKQLRHPWQSAWTNRLLGAKITALTRRGKWIIAELDRPERLVVHLGMTGQLVVVPASEPIADHTHVIVQWDASPHELRFRDVRRFGSMTLHANDAELQAFLGDRLGPEPFELTDADLARGMKSSERVLKALLLDQTIVAGVGNIYADESLFAAKLHPQRRGQSLSDAEVSRLNAAIRGVMARAVAQRGSTIRNYVGGSGLKGGFQEEFAVYGRAGEPCRVCATPIQRVRLAGRATHFCPQCQAPWSDG